MRLLISVLLIHLFSCAFAQAETYDQLIDTAKARMMADPMQALALAQKAEDQIFDNDPVQRATAQWLQGEAMNRMNRVDEAYVLIEGARELLGQDQYDSKLYADLLVAKAGIASAQAKFGQALSDYQMAHSLYQKLGESRAQSMTLMHMANIHAEARDFSKALEYSQRSEQIFAQDANLALVRLNNIATAHRELGDYEAALRGLDRAITLSESLESPMLKARILANIAAVKLDAGQYEGAKTALDEAFALEQANPSGWDGPIKALYARHAFALEQPMRAAHLMDTTFAGMDLTQTTTSFLEFHEFAYLIYDTVGQSEKALRHLAAFKRLDDEKRNIAASANTALINAQFDFAEQELQIEKLKTEALQSEVYLRTMREDQRMLIFQSAAMILILTLFGGMVFYRRMRLSRDEVNEINNQLSQSNQALEKALRVKSEFLATTSHEIRTPLNAMLGMSELMMKQKTDPEETCERARLMHASGQVMKAIVDDFLDMSKIESGTITVQNDAFDLQDMLTSVSAVWQARIDEKDLRLECDFSKCPEMIISDERKLRQIILNLMSNAVKFTMQGQIEVMACLKTHGLQNELVFCVADTGCGVDSDRHEEIFEPFTQIDSSTSRQYSGTGLGLPIARNFARAMGGDITVRNNADQGAIFTLTVPVQQVEKTTDQAEASGRFDLVLVESNGLRQSLLEALIQGEGILSHALDDLNSLFELARYRDISQVFISQNILSDIDETELDKLVSMTRSGSEHQLIFEGKGNRIFQNQLTTFSTNCLFVEEDLAPMDLSEILIARVGFNQDKASFRHVAGT